MEAAALEATTHWPREPALMFTIQAFSAVNLGELSWFPTEAECILLPGTCMVVTGTDVDRSRGEPLWRISLTEISHSPALIA